LTDIIEFRAKEIESRIAEINVEQLATSRKGNDLWEEKNILANEYRELTGKEIV